MRRERSSPGRLVLHHPGSLARAVRERSDPMTKPSRPARKPYRPPRLTKFGDLRRLTRGDRKNKSEPTGEKTKLGGPG
ncbi:MAG: hypothetical protein DMD85_18625 [Candidatus Rokuibacteriota bacterium]|nr:MAG: hypothetical protein DMD85_18625 [Candidatus Rokubacteria bacterium]